ncbi:MAG: HNH endonuclease [SAR324 cluster bacterium]|nr:HNH endonuclease [SAR324 cluster bacterium]
MSRSSNQADFFITVSTEEISKEKQKAQTLRKSQWWKNKRACNRCYYCQNNFPAKNLTMDHIVPLARGGKSTKSNIVACCKNCNSQKKYFLPLEWEEYLESLRSKKKTES